MGNESDPPSSRRYRASREVSGSVRRMVVGRIGEVSLSTLYLSMKMTDELWMTSALGLGATTETPWVRHTAGNDEIDPVRKYHEGMESSWWSERLAVRKSAGSRTYACVRSNSTVGSRNGSHSSGKASRITPFRSDGTPPLVRTRSEILVVPTLQIEELST
jgi:hypothetical protein